MSSRSDKHSDAPADSQGVVNVIVKPAVVSKLERGVVSLGQQLQKFAQARQILLQEWRQLKKYRAALRAGAASVV